MLALWIALGAWVFLALLMSFMVKKMTSAGLAYLKCPPVNFLHKCKAAARYDLVHLNKRELYLGAIFLFPPRLCIMLSFVVVCTVGMFFFKLLFCGNGSLR